MSRVAPGMPQVCQRLRFDFEDLLLLLLLVLPLLRLLFLLRLVLLRLLLLRPLDDRLLFDGLTLPCDRDPDRIID